MAKFSKMLSKVDQIPEEQASKPKATLLEIKELLEKTIAYYSDQEKLCNFQEPWYANARDSHERKLEKVNAALLKLGAKHVSAETKATPDVI